MNTSVGSYCHCFAVPNSERGGANLQLEDTIFHEKSVWKRRGLNLRDDGRGLRSQGSQSGKNDNPYVLELFAVASSLVPCEIFLPRDRLPDSRKQSLRLRDSKTRCCQALPRRQPPAKRAHVPILGLIISIPTIINRYIYI